MVEFEDAVLERMAQLEQEDLESYQRDMLRNSSHSYADEIPSYDDEFQRKLPVLLDMVRGIINCLKPTTSSIKNGFVLPKMDHSYSGSETTIELHLVEEFVANKMEVTADIPDLYAIQGNNSSNSEVVPDLEEFKVSESGINFHSLVNPSHQKLLTSIDFGFKVLSIYCAQMATKWRPVLDSQPLQGNDMSVEVYYDQFFSWKGKLEEVNYIGGEESYVDDFLFGLKKELAVRVWEYNWMPQTLYGAFRRALIEENMMKNDADKMLEEMSRPNSIDSRGVKNVTDEYNDVVLDASMGNEFTIKASLIEKDNEGNVVDDGVVPSLFDLQASLEPLGDLIMNGSDNGLSKAFIVSGKYLIEDDAYKVFGELTQEIQASLLDEEVINHSAK